MELSNRNAKRAFYSPLDIALTTSIGRESFARQLIAVSIPATQVVIPVELRCQREHRGTIAALKGCIHAQDDLLCSEGIIHLRRRRVQERSHGGAKQDLRGTANAVAAFETQCGQEARVPEAGAAIPEAKN